MSTCSKLGSSIKSLFLLGLLVLTLMPINKTLYKNFNPGLDQNRACLYWVVYNETKGESTTGARAVLDVVQYRIEKQGLSACKVVAQPHQFQGYYKGAEKNVTQNSLTRYEIAASMPPVLEGCGYFHAIYVKPVWRKKLEVCAIIGNHIFYKDKYDRAK